MNLPSFAPRCDLFCRVIDNYGDIGICWRLARQLLAEKGCGVRIFVDDLAAFIRLCPEATQSAAQVCGGVEIHRWDERLSGSGAVEAADLVIAAFGCALPPPVLEAMAARARTGTAPCWINLEYLTAESWIGECHGLPSPHPGLPLSCHFFFPGFDERSGGLLREHDLPQRRAAFDRAAWWRGIGAEPPEEGIAVSLFAYENPALPGLLRAWEESPVPIVGLVPESRLFASLAGHMGHAPRVGEVWRRGALSLRFLPFVRQEEYDWLLWACELNFVRGEDSLVRALWAEKPCVWQIYPQEAGAHYGKLEAFLARYTVGLSPDAAASLRDLSAYWNSPGGGETAWQNFSGHLPALTTHARDWARKQAMQADLATALIAFARQRR
ncbi:MAG: elongation factor P maturation arginine rhamnosyltransferase EarP [Betaproteobacteria bacterium]|nr:elongation factor P maturation arginine rhamnosyltransferase EarP [Betaproteobacteria bacterium]